MKRQIVFLVLMLVTGILWSNPLIGVRAQMIWHTPVGDVLVESFEFELTDSEIIAYQLNTGKEFRRHYYLHNCLPVVFQADFHNDEFYGYVYWLTEDSLILARLEKFQEFGKVKDVVGTTMFFEIMESIKEYTYKPVQ